MTIEHEQWAVPAGEPNYSHTVGASTAGAITGGALMLLLVLASIIDSTVHLGWVISLGTLPGLNTYLDICSVNVTCRDTSIDIIWQISFIIITMVWLALGVEIMVGTKYHLTRVAIAGLCAVFLFDAVPIMEDTIHTIVGTFRYVGPLTYLGWLLLLVMSLLAPVSLLLLALAGRRGQLKFKPLLIWAIILLSLRVLSQICYSLWGLWSIYRDGIQSAWSIGVPHLAFYIAQFIPWIIVAATAIGRKPISPLPQPEWRPPVLGTP